MAITIRRLTAEEAKALSFDAKGDAKPVESSDPFLDAARKAIEQRERLRSRTLVAHLEAWGKAGIVRLKTPAEIDAEALIRALVLVETEQAKVGRTDRNDRRRVASKFSDRLIALYEEEIKEANRQIPLPGTASLETHIERPDWLATTCHDGLNEAEHRKAHPDFFKAPALVFPPQPAGTQPRLPTLPAVPTDAEATHMFRGVAPGYDPRIAPKGLRRKQS